MGLISTLLFLPVKGPSSGVLWVASKLAEQAETQRNNPAVLREALAEAEQRLLAGELSEEAYDVIEDDILLRLKTAGNG